MLAEYLPIKELQAGLPLDQISALASILARIDGTSRGQDPLSDKQFLARLFEAFAGPTLLAKPGRRRSLISYLPFGKLRALATSMGVSDAGSFDEVAARVCAFTWGRNAKTEAFLSSLGYPLEFLPEEPIVHPSAELITPLGTAFKTLKDYQSSIFFRAMEILAPPCARALVQMPTGSGKTRTAMEIICGLLNERRVSRVLWLAHSEELCDQAADAFTQVWSHIGHAPITLSRCWGGSTPDLPGPDLGVIIAGFPKLNSMRKKGTAAPAADLVVVDEAHMVIAPKFQEVVTWAKTMSARVLGLTATPGRARDALEQNAQLSDFFFNKSLGLETNGEGVIEYLQGRGILSRVEREELHTRIAFHLTTQEWKQLEEDLDYPTAFLKRLAEDAERNRRVIERLWQLADEGVQGLVFAASVDQSRLLCAALLYRGIPSAHVDGETPSELRASAITKFRSKGIRFICNYGVLSTGFDAPGTDAVIIARPTKSIVLYSQMVGRGLRGPSVGGTESCRIIDVIDNIADYSGTLDDVYDYFHGYWNA